eukprot:g8028.t1
MHTGRYCTEKPLLSHADFFDRETGCLLSLDEFRRRQRDRLIFFSAGGHVQHHDHVERSSYADMWMCQEQARKIASLLRQKRAERERLFRQHSEQRNAEIRRRRAEFLDVQAETDARERALLESLLLGPDSYDDRVEAYKKLVADDDARLGGGTRTGAAIAANEKVTHAERERLQFRRAEKRADAHLHRQAQEEVPAPPPTTAARPAHLDQPPALSDRWVCCDVCDQWRNVTEEVQRKYDRPGVRFECTMLADCECAFPGDDEPGAWRMQPVAGRCPPAGRPVTTALVRCNQCGKQRLVPVEVRNMVAPFPQFKCKHLVGRSCDAPEDFAKLDHVRASVVARICTYYKEQAEKRQQADVGGDELTLKPTCTTTTLGGSSEQRRPRKSSKTEIGRPEKVKELKSGSSKDLPNRPADDAAHRTRGRDCVNDFDAPLPDLASPALSPNDLHEVVAPLSPDEILLPDDLLARERSRSKTIRPAERDGAEGGLADECGEAEVLNKRIDIDIEEHDAHGELVRQPHSQESDSALLLPPETPASQEQGLGENDAVKMDVEGDEEDVEEAGETRINGDERAATIKLKQDRSVEDSASKTKTDAIPEGSNRLDELEEDMGGEGILLQAGGGDEESVSSSCDGDSEDEDKNDGASSCVEKLRGPTTSADNKPPHGKSMKEHGCERDTGVQFFTPAELEAAVTRSRERRSLELQLDREALLVGDEFAFQQYVKSRCRMDEDTDGKWQYCVSEKGFWTADQWLDYVNEPVAMQGFGNTNCHEGSRDEAGAGSCCSPSHQNFEGKVLRELPLSTPLPAIEEALRIFEDGDEQQLLGDERMHQGGNFDFDGFSAHHRGGREEIIENLQHEMDIAARALLVREYATKQLVRVVLENLVREDYDLTSLSLSKIRRLCREKMSEHNSACLHCEIPRQLLDEPLPSSKVLDDFFRPELRSTEEVAFFGLNALPSLQHVLEHEDALNFGEWRDPHGFAFVRKLFCAYGGLPPDLEGEEQLGVVRVENEKLPPRKGKKMQSSRKIVDQHGKVLYDPECGIGVVPEVSNTAEFDRVVLLDESSGSELEQDHADEHPERQKRAARLQSRRNALIRNSVAASVMSTATSPVSTNFLAHRAIKVPDASADLGADTNPDKQLFAEITLADRRRTIREQKNGGSVDNLLGPQSDVGVGETSESNESETDYEDALWHFSNWGEAFQNEDFWRADSCAFFPPAREAGVETGSGNTETPANEQDGPLGGGEAEENFLQSREFSLPHAEIGRRLELDDLALPVKNLASTKKSLRANVLRAGKAEVGAAPKMLKNSGAATSGGTVGSKNAIAGSIVEGEGSVSRSSPAADGVEENQNENVHRNREEQDSDYVPPDENDCTSSDEDSMADDDAGSEMSDAGEDDSDASSSSKRKKKKGDFFYVKRTLSTLKPKTAQQMQPLVQRWKASRYLRRKTLAQMQKARAEQRASLFRIPLGKKLKAMTALGGGAGAAGKKTSRPQKKSSSLGALLQGKATAARNLATLLEADASLVQKCRKTVDFHLTEVREQLLGAAGGEGTKDVSISSSGIDGPDEKKPGRAPQLREPDPDEENARRQMALFLRQQKQMKPNSGRAHSCVSSTRNRLLGDIEVLLRELWALANDEDAFADRLGARSVENSDVSEFRAAVKAVLAQISGALQTVVMTEGAKGAAPTFLAANMADAFLLGDHSDDAHRTLLQIHDALLSLHDLEGCVKFLSLEEQSGDSQMQSHQQLHDESSSSAIFVPDFAEEYKRRLVAHAHLGAVDEVPEGLPLLPRRQDLNISKESEVAARLVDDTFEVPEMGSASAGANDFFSRGAHAGRGFQAQRMKAPHTNRMNRLQSQQKKVDLLKRLQQEQSESVLSLSQSGTGNVGPTQLFVGTELGTRARVQRWKTGRLARKAANHKYDQLMLNKDDLSYEMRLRALQRKRVKLGEAGETLPLEAASCRYQLNPRNMEAALWGPPKQGKLKINSRAAVSSKSTAREGVFCPRSDILRPLSAEEAAWLEEIGDFPGEKRVVDEDTALQKSTSSHIISPGPRLPQHQPPPGLPSTFAEDVDISFHQAWAVAEGRLTSDDESGSDTNALQMRPLKPAAKHWKSYSKEDGEMIVPVGEPGNYPERLLGGKLPRGATASAASGAAAAGARSPDLPERVQPPIQESATNGKNIPRKLARNKADLFAVGNGSSSASSKVRADQFAGARGPRPENKTTMSLCYTNAYIRPGTSLHNTTAVRLPANTFGFLDNYDPRLPAYGRFFYQTYFVAQRRRQPAVGDRREDGLCDEYFAACDRCEKWRRVDCKTTHVFLEDEHARFKCSDLLFCNCGIACDTAEPQRPVWGHFRDYRMWARMGCCREWRRIDGGMFAKLSRRTGAQGGDPQGKNPGCFPGSSLTCLDCGIETGCADRRFQAHGWRDVLSSDFVRNTRRKHMSEEHLLNHDDAESESGGEYHDSAQQDRFGREVWQMPEDPSPQLLKRTGRGHTSDRSPEGSSPVDDNGPSDSNKEDSGDSGDEA